MNRRHFTAPLGLTLALGLAVTTQAHASPQAMTRDAVIALAKQAMGYSYYWGHGRWRTDGAQHGTCSGSCPSCSHGGGYGADCSGLAAKVWQVPSPIAVTTDAHPYSTYNFKYESTHWKAIAKGSVKKADIFVHHDGGEGHVFVYEKGDPWGNVWAYECKGCSYGCVHDLRPVYSIYVARQRDLIEDAADTDGDGIVDTKDNCPKVKNADQKNTDGDSMGDACDADDDNDGVLDTKDNCPLVKNANQKDNDGDKKGDVCDTDDDNDGVLDTKDNCPLVKNASQIDTDKDKKGDACDTDDDGDGVLDTKDDCPLVANADQKDTDANGKGDACQADDDDDGILDATDDCPTIPNADQLDTDHDGKGDVCDDDDDDDGVVDTKDDCELVANADQADLDKDGLGDACDDDIDGDGVTNDADVDPNDNCPKVPNADQLDSDGDGLGDVCDDDLDGDAVANEKDNCPTIPNPDQADANHDGVGDACSGDDASDPPDPAAAQAEGDPGVDSGCSVGGDAQDPRGAILLLTLGVAAVVARKRR